MDDIAGSLYGSSTASSTSSLTEEVWVDGCPETSAAGEVWIDGPPPSLAKVAGREADPVQDSLWIYGGQSGDEDSTFSSVKALSQSDMDFTHCSSPMSTSNQYSPQILPSGKVRLHSTPKQGSDISSLRKGVSSKEMFMSNWNNLIKFRPEPNCQSPQFESMKAIFSSDDSDLETTLIQPENTQIEVVDTAHHVTREVTDMSFGSDMEQSFERTIGPCETQDQTLKDTLVPEGEHDGMRGPAARGLSRTAAGLSTTQVIAHVVSEKLGGMFDQTIAL